MSRHRDLLAAGHLDLDDLTERQVLLLIVEILGEQGEELEALHYTLDGILADLTPTLNCPTGFTTSIPGTERNPTTMATQIQSNDSTKRIVVGQFLYADNTPAPDPGVVITWASSNPAVATVDPTSGAITPVLPVTTGAITTLTSSAPLPDGNIVTGQTQDVEIISVDPASFTTAIQ